MPKVSSFTILQFANLHTHYFINNISNQSSYSCYYVLFQANLLFVGHVGAGKSSLCNTLCSAVQGRMNMTATCGSASHSVTTKVSDISCDINPNLKATEMLQHNCKNIIAIGAWRDNFVSSTSGLAKYLQYCCFPNSNWDTYMYQICLGTWYHGNCINLFAILSTCVMSLVMLQKLIFFMVREKQKEQEEQHARARPKDDAF